MALRCIAIICAGFWLSTAVAGEVSFQRNQLLIDGIPQPQLFGAELQYFRLRGGQDKNIPRAKVLGLWAKALDKMVEAKMSVISFYIPWDFHEYEEGKFDFTGEVDADGDGNADYPSRDLLTFFRMIEERGIRHIMARPGPYINAEWGFLGFGAIPRWFHEKYPDSHMLDSRGWRSRLYDYHSPELHRHTKIWFRELHERVLAKYIGPGRPVSFLQIDNETNFMWQSIYNCDYGPRAIARYRAYLGEKYPTLAALNEAQGTNFASWETVDPPRRVKENIVADRDWYAFQDESIHRYLKILRGYWEELGVKEPTVLFTLAESYNAPENGMLPNYRYRNDPGATGMMTVNLYPKTWNPDSNPLMNLPFKADHDVKAAETATDYYLGRREEWVMGPEIQGGWWKGVPVSPEARRQTYLTTIGHGLKALFVYYFTEGDNFEPHWQREQIKPHYDALRATPPYRDVPETELSWEFWGQLQLIIDQNVLVGIPVHHTWHQGKDTLEDLYFDAPLDGEANARPHYYDLKEIAEKVIHPHQEFLGRAVAVEDRVCLVRDNFQHLPSPNTGLDSILLNGDWSGGLLGYVMQTGANPRIVHWDLNPAADLLACDLIFWQDNGVTDPKLVEALQARLGQGATVVSFLEDSLARGLGIRARQERAQPTADNWVQFGEDRFRAHPNLLFRYELGADARCHAKLFDERGSAAGYQCAWGGGGTFLQIGAMPYQLYNSNDYGFMHDSASRQGLLRHFMKLARVSPRLELPPAADRSVAFARTVDGSSLWITAKTGSLAGSQFPLKVRGLRAGASYRVKNLMTGEEETTMGAALEAEGFWVKLGPSGSTVYILAETAR